MKSRFFLLALITLLLAGCIHSRKGYRPNGYYCQHITTQLHAGANRHNAGRKLTAIGEARLMKEYKQYGCEERS